MGLLYEYEKFLPQDSFCMRDDLIKDDPNIRLFIDDSLLMKDANRFYSYKNNNLIEVEVNGDKSKISTDLLYDLIDNEGMFKYLITSLNRDYDNAVSIQLYRNNTLADSIRITKAELVMALRQLDIAKLSPNNMTRMVVVYSLTDVTVCYNNYYDQTYSCFVDGEVVSIPAIELVKLLTCSNKDFRKFINDKKEHEYSKEVIAYLLIDFCEKESLFKKYIFDERTYQRYQELKDFKYIDYESVNKQRKSDDILSDGKSLLDTFDINPDLLNALYEDMDPKYNSIEKAIYLYIRLCDLLTYDDEQYVSNAKLERVGSHSEIENICNITPENNKIVSYEFMLIYAKVLRDLGIKYAVNLNSMAGYVYEKSSIKFKHGEYLISIDLFDDIIKNDMSMVKIGGTLNSIKSYNKNDITHKKFEEMVYEIYTNYKDSKQRRQEFLENVKEYKVNYFRSTASKKDKLYVLFKLIARKDLKGIDNINYIKETLNNVIGDDEDILFDIYISNEDEHPRPIVVISYNNNDDYTYYVIDVNNKESIVQCDYQHFKSMMRYKNMVYFHEQKMLSRKEGAKRVK